MPGDTATAHVGRALLAAGFADAQITAGLGDWCRSFSERYVRLLAESDTSHWELAPSAAEAVAAVERHALLTGNPPAVAHARMDRLGWARFPRDAGCLSVGVATGTYSEGDLSHADAVIADLAGLEAALVALTP